MSYVVGITQGYQSIAWSQGVEPLTRQNFTLHPVSPDRSDGAAAASASASQVSRLLDIRTGVVANVWT